MKTYVKKIGLVIATLVLVGMYSCNSNTQPASQTPSQPTQPQPGSTTTTTPGDSGTTINPTGH